MEHDFTDRQINKERFWRAKEACDTRGMAEFLVGELEALLAENVQMEESPLASKDVLLFEGFKANLAKEPHRAIRYANTWLRIVQARNCILWVEYLRCQADAMALLGNYAQAVRFYENCCKLNPTRPEMRNSYGNALFRMGRVDEAREHYKFAMNIMKNRGGYWAAHNFMMTLPGHIKMEDDLSRQTLQSVPWEKFLEEAPPRKILELSLAETFDLPIFINCRDRLGCLQRLVTWLLEAGYRRIYLLDNASTYPPLRAWYAEICKDPRVTLAQLPENFGYQALWKSGILHQLDIRTPYVYTDPDTVPVEECPKGLVARLYQILRRYPFIDKVGPGLKIDDLPAGFDASTEQSYCHVPVEEQVFFAPCDTTFALYAPLYHYTNFMSLRTRGRMLVRHLPWYLDRGHLPEDEKYYVAHADSGSTFSNQIKSGR